MVGKLDKTGTLSKIMKGNFEETLTLVSESFCHVYYESEILDRANLHGKRNPSEPSIDLSCDSIY